MSVHGSPAPLPKDAADCDDTTMQEALSTAAALAAAAVATDGSAARVSPTVLPVLVTAPLPTPSPAVLSNPQTVHSSSFVPYNNVTSNGICTQQITTHTPHPVQHHLVPVHAPLPVPLLFQTTPSAHPPQTKLRRGKWTAEEEAYADLLIHEFERGMVEGCESGCTLRSFLSRKLHCAPMRISKKYAGKSIGKHVFLSRAAVNASMDDQEGNNAIRAKLLQLEANFYKSLTLESEGSVPYLTSYPGGAILVPHQLVATGTSASFIPCAQTYGQQANQLYQTFLSALQNQTSTSTKMPAPILPAPTTGSPPPLHHMTHLARVTDLTAQQPPKHEHVNLPSQIAPRHVLHHKVHQTPAQTKESTQPPSSFEELDSEIIDMPDFLSGFDKVAAQNSTNDVSQEGNQPKPNNVDPPMEQSQYSPPFTSRSFDDLHQHLGKGLSPRPFDLNCPGFPPLPLDINDPKATTTNDTSTHKSISNNTVNEQSMNADSYAMFAQESVRAVSQHSAYYRTASEGTNAQASFRGQHHVLTPSVVNVANLRAHAMASSEIRNSFISGRDNSSSDWGAYQEESEPGALVSGSDNASDTPSHDVDSDSNCDENPNRKKAKVDLTAPSLCLTPGL